MRIYSSITLPRLCVLLQLPGVSYVIVEILKIEAARGGNKKGAGAKLHAIELIKIFFAIIIIIIIIFSLFFAFVLLLINWVVKDQESD